MPHEPTITVVAESAGWEGRLRSAIDGRNYAKIIIRGTKAQDMNNQMFGFPDVCRTPAPPAAPIPVPYPKVTGCLTALGFFALSNLIIYAVTRRGYGLPRVLFKSNGSGRNDDEYFINLR